MFPNSKNNRKSGTTNQYKEPLIKFRNSDELAKALIKSTEESESFLKGNTFDKNVERQLKIQEIPKSRKKVQFAKTRHTNRRSITSGPIKETPIIDTDFNSDLEEHSIIDGAPILYPSFLQNRNYNEELNVHSQKAFKKLLNNKLPLESKYNSLKGKHSATSYNRKTKIGPTTISAKGIPNTEFVGYLPDYSENSEDEKIIYGTAEDFLKKPPNINFVGNLLQNSRLSTKEYISDSSEEEETAYGSAEDFLRTSKNFNSVENSLQNLPTTKDEISHFKSEDSDQYDYIPKKEKNMNTVMGLSIKRNGELCYPKVLTTPPNISRYLMDENLKDTDLNLNQQKAEDLIEKLKAKFKITDNTHENKSKDFDESTSTRLPMISPKVAQTDIRSDPKVKSLLDKLATYSNSNADKASELASSINETKNKENKIDELIKQISFYASESHKRVNEINAFISQSKESLEKNMNDHITKRQALLQSMQERFSIKMRDIADTCKLLEQDSKDVESNEDTE
ncbi:spindle pole body component 110-like [Teleopsis dalmanni]|uniref:spindle pole body component 110-like n=1 Tax=Teleopsis dalmanni TaxID=139649 RepID=UPI0018CE73D5|nr:spindle pole body component 110-like [Teleopsis dalmanni]